MYLHSLLVPEGYARQRSIRLMDELFDRALLNEGWYDEQHPMISAIKFLRDLESAFYLM